MKDANRIIRHPKIAADLRENALIAAGAEVVPEPSDTTAILAGRGLDLSESRDCIAPMCPKCQTDHLFRNIWHYFDYIVIHDAVADHFNMHSECWSSFDSETIERHRAQLLSIIEHLQYIRSLSAESLVKFRRKPFPCVPHWNQHAKEVGLSHVITLGEELIPVLAKEAAISIKREQSNHLFANFIHPAFEIDHIHVDLRAEQINDKTESEIRRVVAEEVIARFVAYLTTDIIATAQFKVPLGGTILFHARLLEGSQQLSTTNVAFKIDMPVLQGVPVQTLIKIRRDEDEYFKRFQSALRRAINERFKGSETIDMSQLTREIRQDIIEPELRRIRERLVAAETLLNKKAAVGIFLTSLATTCGLLAGVAPSLAVAGGLAPVITLTGQAASKYLEEKRDIELEDMYFLWKAIQHQH